MTKPIDESLRIHLASRTPYLYLVSWEEDRVRQRVNRLAADYYPKTFT